MKTLLLFSLLALAGCETTSSFTVQETVNKHGKNTESLSLKVELKG